MKRSLLAILTLVILMGLFSTTVSAQGNETENPARDEALSPKALEISNNIHCPVCEGQSVRDSNSQLARDMREIVQQKLDEGYTEKEIYDYFSDRYGVGILREPPKSGFFLTLWWAPVIGVAVGALVLGTFVVQRRGVGNLTPVKKKATVEPVDDDADLDRYEQQLIEELERDNSRGGR